eukprot:PhF_6_TR36202/c0_g1_i1/m.52803
MDVLHSVRSKITNDNFKVNTDIDRISFINYSIILPAIESVSQEALRTAMDTTLREDYQVDRAVGAVVGLVIGDAAGHPLEFMEVCSSPEHREGFLHDTLVDGQIAYTKAFNRFRLHPGQWTDDASMSLCVADSLLACGTYIGGDCRARFHAWWEHGYNNAFRFDKERARRSSVGLGGNISHSISDLTPYNGLGGKDIPAVFKLEGSDAGNGSLMRLAPVPVRFCHNLPLAMDIAALHSQGTHPGPHASDCCRFVTYFVSRAILRPKDDPRSMKDFLHATIAEYIETDKPVSPLLDVLTSTAPSPKETCWNWKSPRFLAEETLAARGRSYNGHPVSAGYFGAYCMDGLAMSLWGLHHSTTASDCYLNVINLCGDADTTGAIVGQMIGAFYGLGRLGGEPLTQCMVRNMGTWDPYGEIPLRAALLFLDGRAAGPSEPNQSVYTAPPRPPSPVDSDDDDYVKGGVAQEIPMCAHCITMSAPPTQDVAKQLVVASCTTCDADPRRPKLKSRGVWICTVCHQTLCGQDQQFHMQLHGMESNHSVVVGVEDFSFWCYKCNKYLSVFNDASPVRPWYLALAEARFGKPE